MFTTILTKQVSSRIIVCRSAKTDGNGLNDPKPAAFVKRAADRKKEMEDDRMKRLQAMHEQVKLMFKEEVEYIQKLVQETSDQHKQVCDACHKPDQHNGNDVDDSLLKELDKEEELVAQQSNEPANTKDVFVDKSANY